MWRVLPAERSMQTFHNAARRTRGAHLLVRADAILRSRSRARDRRVGQVDNLVRSGRPATCADVHPVHKRINNGLQLACDVAGAAEGDEVVCLELVSLKGLESEAVNPAAQGSGGQQRLASRC